MSAPDAPEPRGAVRIRGVLRMLLQNGRGRSTVLLALFALVLFGAGRRAPDAPRPSPAPGGAASSESPRRAEPPLLSAGGTPAATRPEPTPEAVALDNLLARYDALIRLLETRSIGEEGPSADSALAELRALRGRTYAAARRAVTATGDLRDP